MCLRGICDSASRAPVQVDSKDAGDLFVYTERSVQPVRCKMTLAGDPPLTRRLCLTYGIGSIGAGIFSTIPGLLLLFYLTDTLGVAAGLAGLAILLPKLWDITTDPIVGTWSDRTQSRWGRRRPFLLAGALTLPPCFIALFAAPVGDPGLAFVWVLASFCAAATAFTLFQIPYAAMPAELSADYHERTTLVAYRMAFVTVGVLAGGAVAPALIEAGGAGAAGYLMMAVVLSALTCITMLVAFFGTRSAPPSPPPNRGLRFAEQVRIAVANQPYRRLWVTYATQCVALGGLLAAVPYFVRYTLKAGPEVVTLLFVCLVLPAIVTMPLWTALSRRIGKRGGYLVAVVLFVAMAASLVTAGPGPLVWIAAQVGLIGVGFAGMQVFPFAILPEIIDADAATTGRRREGVFTGLWYVGEKGGFAGGAWLVSTILAATGFVERHGDTIAVQPEAALLGIHMATSLAPALVAGLSVPLLLRFQEPTRTPA